MCGLQNPHIYRNRHCEKAWNVEMYLLRKVRWLVKELIFIATIA
jgi:hypothetical protein